MREEIFKLIDEFSKKTSEAKKKRWFEMIFYKLGERDFDSAVKKLEGLGLRDKVLSELKSRISDKLKSSDRSYMHRWSRDIIDKLNNATGEFYYNRAIEKANNIIRSATKPDIVNRIYEEVAEGLEISVADLKKLLSSAPKDRVRPSSKKQHITKKDINSTIFECLDALGLEYETLKKVTIGKYNLIVGAYIHEYDAIVDVIKEDFESYQKNSQAQWRKRELSSRFKKSIFFTPKESVSIMHILTTINERLGLEMHAMELLDIVEYK